MTLSASPAARSHARERWHALADRLRTIRPEALAKGAIGITLILVSVQLVVASWPALLPFIIGAVLAYTVLPLANRLDRFMPRVLAALLAELVALAVLAGVVAVITPPMLAGLGIVAAKLPAPDQVRTWVASLQDQVGAIPEPMRTIALSVLTQTATNLQGVLHGLVNQAAGVITSQLLGIFGTLSNVLGLLVIPTWILTLVADERAIKQRGARLFPEAVRADVAALFRIADRVASTFLRVRVLLALATGIFVYAGVTIGNELGFGEGTYAVAAAVLLGSLQLIPELGYLLGFATLLIPLAIGGPVAAGVFALVYIVSVKAASILLEGRLARGVLDVHPGILIPAIVVLSQFGLIWLFAAAPAVAIIRDLVRYANARLSDPPGPAGVLPGEPVKDARTGTREGSPVPSVYRAPASSARAAQPRAMGTIGPAPAVAALSVVAVASQISATLGGARSPSVAPVRLTRPAPGMPVPAVYANAQPRTAGRPPAVSQRSTQP
jgi:predicted PurR-regulated permease PerM